MASVPARRRGDGKLVVLAKIPHKIFLRLIPAAAYDTRIDSLRFTSRDILA
jgi:hypothetical protein